MEKLIELQKVVDEIIEIERRKIKSEVPKKFRERLKDLERKNRLSIEDVL